MGLGGGDREKIALKDSALREGPEFGVRVLPEIGKRKGLAKDDALSFLLRSEVLREISPHSVGERSLVGKEVDGARPEPEGNAVRGRLCPGKTLKEMLNGDVACGQIRESFSVCGSCVNPRVGL